MAPLAVAGLIVIGVLVGGVRDPGGVPARLALPLQPQGGLTAPLGVAAAMGLIMAGILVAAYYAVEALQGERRDRSILFWKSLPVSDTTTVMAKAAIPMVVLPALSALLIIVTQFLLLLLGSGVVLVAGGEPGSLWAAFPYQLWPTLPYFLLAATLWHAPLYGWLLLASAWARRAALLWAVLPVLPLGMVERLAFPTAHVPTLLAHRWMGSSTGRSRPRHCQRPAHCRPPHPASSCLPRVSDSASCSPRPAWRERRGCVAGVTRSDPAHPHSPPFRKPPCEHRSPPPWSACFRPYFWPREIPSAPTPSLFKTE